ncbi:MAG: hypothetical protein JXB13_22080 [Phycisphaerae bacterium]|nr:hypothetical protein [Phycisphaerae bacterium]
MSTFPLTFKIVRNGGVEEVRVDDRPELVRLRTELELIRQYGRGADRSVVDALQAIAARSGDDVRELLTILQDAMNPLVEAGITRIDREFPGVRREMSEPVIASEAAKFRSDVAACIRRSARPDAAALADAYLRRSQLELQDIELPAETGVAAAGPVIGSASGPTPQQERNTMSTNASNSQNGDLEALGKDIDAAVDSSARAAADDNVEAVLKAAVEAADQLEVNDTNDEVDQFLDDALAQLDGIEDKTEDPGPSAPAATAPVKTNDEAVDVDAFIAAVEEADQLEVSDSNQEVAELLSEALQQADQGSPAVQDDLKAADLDALTAAVEQADRLVVGDANDEIQSVLSDALKETSTHEPPADAAAEDAQVDLEAFAAAVEEADKQEIGDSNEDIDNFLAQALEQVDAVATPEPEASPVSGPEQLEQIARGEPRPQPSQCTDVAQTVEAAIDEVESHLEQVASQVDVGADEVTTTAVPTASVDLESGAAADDVLADVEEGVTALANAVGQPPAPEGPALPQAAEAVAPTSPAPSPQTPSPDAGKTAAAPPVAAVESAVVPENIQPPTQPAAAAKPPVETGKSREPAPKPQTAESPAKAQDAVSAASAPENAVAEETVTNALPAAAVDDIERGVGRLAHFLSGEVLQLWTEAKRAMQEAQAFRDESQRVHAEAGRMLKEVQAMQQEVAAAREQTQGDRQEAQNLRDDIRKTLERVRQCAGEAANAADAAQAEARNAAAFAQQARPSQTPKQDP